MMTDLELLKAVQLGAVVRHVGKWWYVLLYPGEMILDYASYNPESVERGLPSDFRGGIAVITCADGQRFLDALPGQVFEIDQIPRFMAVHAELAIPEIAIDFDNCVYVNGYFDRAYEDLAGAGIWN